MDLKQLDRLVQDADENSESIIESSVRYSFLLDGYIHTRDADTLPEELESVSPQELYRGTRKFVETVEDYEKKLHQLEDAARKLERVNEHRSVPESGISRRSVEKDLARTYEAYQENLKHAWDVFSRASRIDTVPNPFMMKSERKRNYDPVEENTELLELIDQQGY